MTCDEYELDSLTWVLKVFLVSVCEDTGFRSVKGT